MDPRIWFTITIFIKYKTENESYLCNAAATLKQAETIFLNYLKSLIVEIIEFVLKSTINCKLLKYQSLNMKMKQEEFFLNKELGHLKKSTLGFCQ